MPNKKDRGSFRYNGITGGSGGRNSTKKEEGGEVILVLVLGNDSKKKRWSQEFESGHGKQSIPITECEEELEHRSSKSVKTSRAKEIFGNARSATNRNDEKAMIPGIKGGFRSSGDQGRGGASNTRRCNRRAWLTSPAQERPGKEVPI